MLPKHRFKQVKKHTFTLESKNATLRLFAKMLNRGTSCFTKTFNTINGLITITINKINNA